MLDLIKLHNPYTRSHCRDPLYPFPQFFHILYGTIIIKLSLFQTPGKDHSRPQTHAHSGNRRHF